LVNSPEIANVGRNQCGSSLTTRVCDENTKKKAAPGLGENQSVSFSERRQGGAEGVPCRYRRRHDAPASDVRVEDIALERGVTPACASAEISGYD
jgi:hypothetical protein